METAIYEMHAAAVTCPSCLSTCVCRLLSLHLLSRVKMLDLLYFAHESLAVQVVVGVSVLQVFPIGHHGGGFAG